MPKYYITTPIYYLNSSPHIGHSYTNIAADTIANVRKLCADEVYFLTGTDEHGQKIQKAADAQGLSPQEFTDKMVVQFVDLWKRLKISNSDFIRTTQERHKVVVSEALDILYRKGDIYQSRYEGWYCTPCETFWVESDELKQACPDCGRALERISEVNYFLDLQKYQNWLIQYIEGHPYFIRPLIRRNEVLSFLKLNKLSGLCISRPKERLNWGIPLPFSPSHVTYVWFDALLNYISAVGGFNEEGRYVSKWWPAQVQLIGKDILRQHAVYWPIMLRALDIEPPETIFAHGWWLLKQDKMSKSLGNVVSPLDMIDKYGLDVYKYFLLRDVNFGSDGNFSEEAIITRFNSDLANDLGNLVYRGITMVEKYFQGDVPDVEVDKLGYNGQAKDIMDKLQALNNDIYLNISAENDFNFSLSLQEIWDVINSANKFIESSKPWNMFKEKKEEELKKFIRLLIEVLRGVSFSLSPFMPDTAKAIKDQVCQQKVIKGQPLFPRIEKQPI